MEIISEMVADILELISRPSLTYSQVTFVAGARILGTGLSYVVSLQQPLAQFERNPSS